MYNSNDTEQTDLSVGIIGCGWLGKALAVALMEKGVSILATSSKQENVDKLIQQGINAQQLLVPSQNEQLSQQDIFAQHYLVIAITPQFKKGRTDYADKIAQLVNAAQKRGITQRIILLSTTGVYQGLTGIVNEESRLNTTIAKVAMIEAAEQVVLKFKPQANVIRLAGFLGPDRPPREFVLASTTLTDSMAPVNFIHQQDAVGLIESLLTTGANSGIFNGVCDTHVSKRHFYQVATKALPLDAAVLSSNGANDIDKIVSGDKAKQGLNYKFIYPELLTWL